MQPRRETVSALRVSSVAARFALAIVTVTIGIFVCLVVGREFGGSPVNVLLLSVIATAWYGGTGPGVLATTLSALYATYFLMVPGGSFTPLSPLDVVRLSTLIVTGTVISVLFGALQRTGDSARRAAADRQRALDELSEERARFSALLEHMPAGAVLADAEGRIVFANPQLEQILGHPVISNPDAASIREYAALHPTEDRPLEVHEYPVIRAVRGETLANTQIRYRRPDGRIIWLRVSGAPIRDRGGRISGAVDLFWNIDDEKRAESALQAAEIRLDVALSAAHLGAWHLELDTMRLECTPMCKANFGRTPDSSFSYSDLLNAIHADDRAVMQAAVHESLSNRREYAIEYRVVWPDGSVHWIGAQGRTTYGVDGKPVAMDGITVDITERRHLADRLREQAAALRDADRRKDHFLATLSHELRNPLQAIQAASQVLEARGSNPQVAGRALGVIDRQTRQMWRLVDDLLEISRIAEGKIDLRVSRIDAREVVAAAAETVRPQFEQRRQALRLVTPAADSVPVEVDSVRFTQVVVNLLTNASKYTDEGGHVIVTTEVADGEAHLRVRDNGIGIPSEMLTKVFEPFEQVEAHRDRAQGGLGLGLTLVHRLVQLHGGSVTVHSDGPGHGSEFVVRLPLAS
jgi:PAS domain S-box-containing protein